MEETGRQRQLALQGALIRDVHHVKWVFERNYIVMREMAWFMGACVTLFELAYLQRKAWERGVIWF